MNIEENRLNTFRDWPSSAEVEPIRIAKAGFYYTGQRLEVQCFCCDCKISEWNYGDQVMQRHRLINPTCTFVLDPDQANNVSLVLSRDATGSGSIQGSFETPSNVSTPVNYYTILHDEHLIYRNYALRLMSFVNWPPDIPVSSNQVARAGLYHLGRGRVRCMWCAGEINGADLGSDPKLTHDRIYGFCRNLRLEALNLSSTGPYQSSSPPDSIPDSDTILSDGMVHNEQILRSTTWRSMGVIGSADGARHSDKTTLNARLQTYSFWPPEKVQTPQELAEAGFFYTGLEDRVRCFYCDGGLGSWESNDVPWNEHARWFPQCAYVLLIKGQEFVNRCKDPSLNMSGKENNNKTRRNTFPVADSQVEEIMESPVVIGALDMGLDAARVRAAIVQRLRFTGVGFSSSESLLDAVLQQQLSETSWSARPSPGSLSIWENMANRIGMPIDDSVPPDMSHYVIPQNEAELLNIPQNGVSSEHEMETSILPQEPARGSTVEDIQEHICTCKAAHQPNKNKKEDRQQSLEEENRQLRESRLCKVCMDREVTVVFLPCGHLVTCASCVASLLQCPLCRADIRALVRAYLA